MANFNKIVSRVNETRWARLYIAMACFQVFIIIIIQAFIAVKNTEEINPISNAPFPTGNLSEEDRMRALDRFKRIKWENIAFIGFQGWFLGMAFDATVSQNAAEIVALAVLNMICAIFGAVEVVDGSKWTGKLWGYGIDITPLSIAEKAEIALTVCILLFAGAFAWLSWEMYRQLGWNIYKKLGADISLRVMYRWIQFFVLTLKINIFTHFIVSLFYLIQWALKNDNGFDWETLVQIVITVLIPPALWFARVVVSRESHSLMMLFIVFQLVIIIHFGLIFSETMEPSNNWYFWICLVWLGIFMAIITSVEGFMVRRNFGKGLKPFVQRGQRKQDQDLELNQKQNAGSPPDWTID
ncbi:hypothetical protein BC936DRAFT_139487 [Jimgerdemannia flammicorona]|uniref:Uncharacterized protein n=1 Tax=Jimgerdemannia flammicorona TaxID=994334 RepID=A0A433B9U0_9FUNG|nr:hypothetical protein BC936DRAFT_139487 [Jimgerdemannia flammicorona]